MKKGRPYKSKRLVPLNVSITPEQLQYVIDAASELETSMGHVIRKLIDNAIGRLHQDTQNLKERKKQ